MKEDDKGDLLVKWCARVFGVILIAVILFLLCVTNTGCTRTMYVPVKEVETVYKTNTDTIIRTDSIIRETERIVMQLDSQAMAKYGITLSNAERAWLVREKELENKINMLLEKKADTLIVRDTIPVPYPVEKPFSTIQKVWIKIGKLLSGVTLCSLFLILVYIFAIKRK